MGEFKDVILVCNMCGEELTYDGPKVYPGTNDDVVEPHPCLDCYMQMDELHNKEDAVSSGSELCDEAVDAAVTAAVKEVEDAAVRKFIKSTTVAIPKADTFGAKEGWWVSKGFRRAAWNIALELGLEDLCEEYFDDVIRVLYKMGVVKFVEDNDDQHTKD